MFLTHVWRIMYCFSMIATRQSERLANNNNTGQRYEIK